MPRTESYTNAKDYFDDVVRMASLRNRDVFVEILVAIGGKNQRQWFLTTSTGRSTFLRVSQKAAQLQLLPLDWDNALFKTRNSDVDNLGDVEEIPQVQAISTSELLNITIELTPPNSHMKRLSAAIELIENSKDSTSISVRQATALVKASLEYENIGMQNKIMSILLQSLPQNDATVMDALAAAQLPLLQRIENGTIDHLFHARCSSIDHDGDHDCDRGLATLLLTKVVGVEKDMRNVTFDDSGSMRVLRCLEAAELARRGNQIGEKHGCVICVPRNIIRNNDSLLKAVGMDMDSIEDLHLPELADVFNKSSTNLFHDVVIGRGWNHNVVLNGKGGKKRMIHAECHAVADTIRNFGEDLAFDRLFPHAVAVIVELHEDTAYDNAPPCPKCNTLLRAVGISKTYHSTDKGLLQDYELSPPNLEFLDRETVRIPLRTACNELGIDSLKLTEAERRIASRARKEGSSAER